MLSAENLSIDDVGELLLKFIDKSEELGGMLNIIEKIYCGNIEQRVREIVYSELIYIKKSRASRSIFTKTRKSEQFDS